MGAAIRPAVRADRARIEAIVAAAYRPYLERMGRPPAPMLDDYSRRIEDGQTFVLEQDGTILGILVLEDHADRLLLDNIAVDPNCHGQGLGRRLISFTEAEAGRRGFASVRLYTNEVMVENIALYRRLGYQETGRLQVDGYDRVYLQKDLR